MEILLVTGYCLWLGTPLSSGKGRNLLARFGGLCPKPRREKRPPGRKTGRVYGYAGR